MHFEELFEPIEVISYFRDGTIQPLKFRWNGRVYKISQVHGQWKARNGEQYQYHFSVSCGSPDCFELVFDTADFTWYVARVCLEG